MGPSFYCGPNECLLRIIANTIFGASFSNQSGFFVVDALDEYGSSYKCIIPKVATITKCNLFTQTDSATIAAFLVVTAFWRHNNIYNSTCTSWQVLGEIWVFSTYFHGKTLLVEKPTQYNTMTEWRELRVLCVYGKLIFWPFWLFLMKNTLLANMNCRESSSRQYHCY